MLAALTLVVLLHQGLADERKQLTDGVGELAIPGGIPGAMVASGSPSFVVITGGGKVPVCVATHVGKGRAMALGHGAFFSPHQMDNASNRRFFTNTITWLGKKPLNQLSVGLLQSDVMESFLKTLGARGVALTPSTLNQLDAVQVICMAQGALDGNLPAQQQVLKFVKDGGGLLVSGPAWGWVQVTRGKDLTRDHTGNRLLMDYGVGFTGDTADGPFSPAGADDPALTTYGAMDILKGKPKKDDALAAVSSIQRSIRLMPDFDKDLKNQIGLLASKEAAAGPMPTQAHPITWQTPFSRIKVALDLNRYDTLEPDAVRKDPTADDFPGPVPNKAKRIAKLTSVSLDVQGWHGVGAYAAPGEVVIVHIPEEAANLGLRIRIGAQKDTLWHVDKWTRHPQITEEIPLKGTQTRVASPFGGLIYLVVPRGAQGNVKVRLENVVAAPEFVLGQTNRTEWLESNASSAPWADLQGRYIALTLPHSAVANLKDPSALMRYWDEVATYCCDLYSAPKPERPERYCVDRQISAGYMHSGYPIMTHEDVAATFADVEKLRSNGGPVWGFYHELGHNFQESDWTWNGCGEVTNNLFSLYGNEMLNGITPATYGLAHSALKPEESRKRLENYLKAGAPYEEWKKEPFLALTMYVQLRVGFGWEPFKKVFAEYRNLTRSERPKSDEEKRDQWMVRFSHAVGRNLGPFFQAWGVPTSVAARKSIADLPGWMPADWPNVSRETPPAASLPDRHNGKQR